MRQDKIKLAAAELRLSEPTDKELAKIKRREIYIICDNVLDTYNIGSIFRLADAVAASGVYICGRSDTPPNPRIAKASIGTDKWVYWQYFKDAKTAIANLRGKFPATVIPAKAGIRKDKILDHVEDDRTSGIKVVAVEQGKGSVDFRRADYATPIAFVVGHETRGVSKETLKMCDEVVEIPMYGVNISLNVMVSLAIVLFRVV